MKEQKQKQNKPEQKVYKCPNGKAAQFCCSQPICNKVSIKCIASNQCNTCKTNHNRCPRQIRITNVVQLAQQKYAQAVPIQQKVSEEDLIQRLIDQLIEVKKKYIKIDNKRWGMNLSLSELIFDKELLNKKGSQVANLISSKIIYPELRYYRPPQFRKDAEQVYKINQEFQKRMLALHNVYKSLAEISCELTLHKNLQTVTINLTDLKQLHLKFKRAIFERLAVTPMFGGVEHPTTDTQISDFKNLAIKLFNITFPCIQLLKNKREFKGALEFISLTLDLFNEDRKQYRLEIKDEKNIQKVRQIILEYEALLCYETGSYRKAYEYYSKLSQQQYNPGILKKLIKMCEELQQPIQILLKYLLMLESFEVENIELLENIIKCYERLNDQKKLYQYYKKVNEIQGRNEKNWKSDMLVKRLLRYKWIVQYEQQLHTLTTVLNTITDALKNIEQDEMNFQLIWLTLFFRYKLALFHRFANYSNSQAALHGIWTCEKALRKLDQVGYQVQRIQKDRHTYLINDYLMKFLLLNAQTENNRLKKIINLQKTVKIMERFGIKLFQPYYQLAKLTYQDGNENAYSYQVKALDIYPTHICYANLAYLLYQRYFKEKLNDESILRQCIKNIEKSLSLKPDQIQLYLLRALTYQNLRRHKESNKDFEMVVNKVNGKRKADAERRMAENYLFILKNQSQSISQQEKTKILDKAKILYENCLNQNKQDQKCILGYGRVLKLSKKFQQAENQLKQLLNSNLQNQAYMELGNIKQELGKLNDERDFDLLDQALALYKKAGQSKQNYQNLKRIYLELDEPIKAQEIQKQIDQMQRKRIFNRP